MPTSLNGVPTICPKEAILQVAPAIFEKFAGRELVSRYELALKGEKLTFLQKNISI